ncbi:hypothetical protein GGD38_001679 [Chitinophagaceae bacterium OAS944]|jgi:hypothetical protein|nr:hypothetical protein [Chitinophagaceae bacterium OAS944]
MSIGDMGPSKKTAGYPIKDNPPMTCRKRALKLEMLIVAGTTTRFVACSDLLLKY